YASWAPDQAAEDFVGRLVEAGRSHTERTGGGEAFIPIILDGGNAWGHFSGGGRPFLPALDRRIGAPPGLRAGPSEGEGDGGVRRGGGGAGGNLSGLVDRRELLYLDRSRRRSEGLESTGRCPNRAGRGSAPGGRPGDRERGPHGDSHRRR